ncbi:hypothetical protein KDA82_03285 [Streptomyces daliensis]|uniref:Subtilisin inhibitor domain-containing protein n=1 Tax=Streptomyces daliensis TaxID=299421 RepID=A0A8T4IIC6_9ACTN|nr:hypothetical protein [Streptomyces daliensis]
MRRFAATAVVVLAAAATSSAALSPATAAPAAPLPLPTPVERPSDSLTVTVSETGDPADARTYTLDCHPAGGTHPNARAACEQLDGNSRWGQDTFAPTSHGTPCTQIHGGPATAHIEGTWSGRRVDADYDRGNGCEVARWDELDKVLTTG